MRKKKNKPQRNSKPKRAAAPSPEEASEPDRRNVIKLLRNAAIAAPIVGGLGYYAYTSMQASLGELDLGKIGNGKPAIVQIHDPQCALCRTLQDQTREVLGDLEGNDFEYLIANIKTTKGKNLATRFGVPHVTLLLFDSKGNMMRTVRGPLHIAPLRTILTEHIEKYS